MSTTGPPLNLYLPWSGQTDWGAQMNANLTAINTAISNILAEALTRYPLSPTPDSETLTFTAPVTVSTTSFVTKNGIILTSGAGNDYTFTGDTITFSIAPAPEDNIALYQQS